MTAALIAGPYTIIEILPGLRLALLPGEDIHQVVAGLLAHFDEVERRPAMAEHEPPEWFSQPDDEALAEAVRKVDAAGPYTTRWQYEYEQSIADGLPHAQAVAQANRVAGYAARFDEDEPGADIARQPWMW